MARKPGILSLLKLKVEGIGEPYYFLGKPDQVESLKQYTGVDVAIDKEQNKPRIAVAELVRSGVAEAFNISYEKGSALHYARVLVAADKANAAKTEMEGKGFNGGTIVKVYKKGEDSFI